MDKKKILLTYDYELFLGSDSGDLKKTLIEPTDKILKILNKSSFKGLFFIDATFLLSIQREECFFIVKEQIQKMIQDGHDIGFHLHPHWKDAITIDSCRWKLENYRYFRLHNLSDRELLTLVKDSYRLLSSRAAGWSIQPFDKVKEIFLELGIKYDFSVLPNMADDDRPRHFFDYKRTPKKLAWRFENDILKEDLNGNFIAVANTTYNMNIIDLMKNRKRLKGYTISGNGKGAGRKKSFLEQLKRVRWSVKQIVSSDAIDLEIFKKYVPSIDKDFLVYVSHPKLFSANSFEVLSYITKNFKSINYREIKI